MALSELQAKYILDMTIKYRDKDTRKRLKRRLIDKSEYAYLRRMYMQMDNDKQILNIMRVK